MSTLHDTAAQLGELCAEKNAAYGDSVGTSAKMLALLYPNGLRPEQYLDALFAARDFDKRSRLAHGTTDPHGEDPRLDIAGYALLSLHHHSSEVTRASCANASAAQAPSPAVSDSAPSAAPAPTTPSASASNASSSPPPSCARSTAAFASAAASAPGATANAPSGVGVPLAQERARERNLRGLCACCGAPGTLLSYAMDVLTINYGRVSMKTCSLSCALALRGPSQEATR